MSRIFEGMGGPGMTIGQIIGESGIDRRTVGGFEHVQVTGLPPVLVDGRYVGDGAHITVSPERPTQNHLSIYGPMGIQKPREFFND